YIDDLLIDTLPINDVPDCLWNTMSLVDEQQSCNVERSGYVNNNLESDEVCFTDVVSLNASGLMDTSATAISSSDIRQHLRQRINITEELTTLNDNIYLVPHGKNPVNEYFNTSFLPGLYPTLFPYGVGGVEDKRRQVRVPYGKHIRYFLSYHDHRFEMNTSFIFVTFNILQRRTACAKARILVSRPYFSSQSIEINQLTAAEVKIALNQIESNTFTYNSNPRLSALLKQFENYFWQCLPNIFITINPCDLHHPLAMKFAGVDLDIDNLMVDQMPKSQDRAAIVAKHPVAIARFFNKLITTVLSTLIGYDTNKHASNPDGGVLGEIDAYYGTVEESGRGALHLHMLLWLLKEKANSTTNESFMIDDLPLNVFKSFHENCEQDDEQNESFELEAGIDEEHLVLCNKRIDYELRSLQLSHVCLYDFYSEYRKTKITTADKVLFEANSIPTSEARRGRPLNDRWLFQADHPQYFSHLIIRRSFNVVPVLIGPAIPRRDREDTAERYARAILTLFYPWRSALDVCDLNQTWCDALKVREATFTARSNKVINNIQLLHDCKRDRDSDLFQLVNQPLPSRPVNTSSPYNDADIEDAEEILALLDESNHLNSLSLNERAIEG
ncbi:unnamed protein product, partial [Rotaria sp. Silwood1]